jgi:hypothetical protein
LNLKKKVSTYINILFNPRFQLILKYRPTTIGYGELTLALFLLHVSARLGHQDTGDILRHPKEAKSHALHFIESFITFHIILRKHYDV